MTQDNEEAKAADMPAADAPAADTRAAETPAETEPAAVDWRSDWSDPSRNSAVKVQAMARGKSARALVADRKAQKRYSEHSHAARVQAAQRGKAARTRVKQLRNSAAATAEAPAEPVAPPAEAPAEAPAAAPAAAPAKPPSKPPAKARPPKGGKPPGGGKPAAKRRAAAGAPAFAKPARPPSEVEAAFAAERAARERLNRVKTKVQRELRKLQQSASVEESMLRRREQGESTRVELERVSGREFTAKVMGTAKLRGDELKALSKLFNDKLEIFHPDSRNFYKLFKQMDLDGNQRIGFDEVEAMVRVELRLGKKALPESKLHGLWRAIDEDDSGFISAGELARFMRLGKRGIGKTAAERQWERNVAVTKSVRADLDRRQGKTVARKLADVAPAAAEDVDELATLFAQMLARLPAHQRNYFKLFKQVDTDRSGFVEFSEMSKMVRSAARDGGLGLDRERLPEPKLQSLWRALDTDGSGLISLGEFGRFMRRAPLYASAAANRELKTEERIEREESKRKEKDAKWAAAARADAEASARRLAAEAAKLEASLEAATSAIHGAFAQGRLGSSVSLPQLPSMGGPASLTSSSIDARGSGAAMRSRARKELSKKVKDLEGRANAARIRADPRATPPGLGGLSEVYETAGAPIVLGLPPI